MFPYINSSRRDMVKLNSVENHLHNTRHLWNKFGPGDFDTQGPAIRIRVEAISILRRALNEQRFADDISTAFCWITVFYLLQNSPKFVPDIPYAVTRLQWGQQLVGLLPSRLYRYKLSCPQESILSIIQICKWATDIYARSILCPLQGSNIYTLRPRQNDRHFADDVFKHIFLNENAWIAIQISLKCIHRGSMNNMPALVQIMTWRLTGEKP